MKHAFVTGATGLVGSHLVSELLGHGDWSVSVAVRSVGSVTKLADMLAFDGLSIDSVSVHIIDLGSIDELRSYLHRQDHPVDVIFHCAAQVSIGRSRRNAKNGEQLVRDNVEITHNICTAALESSPQPILVHVSSIATLGNGSAPNTVAIDEDSIMGSLAEASPYSRSKFLAENEVWRAAAHGLSVVVVNPAVVIGRSCEGMNFWFAALVRRVARGLPLRIDGTTGWVAATDVARAMVMLADSPALCGQRFLLCADNMSYRSLLDTIATATGTVPRVTISIPGRLLLIAARLWPPLGSVAAQRWQYDGSLVTRRLPGFEYEPLEDTIRKIVKANPLNR